MAASQGKKVSLYRIMGNVIGNLGLNSASDKIDDIARWMVEAELKIGSRNSTEHEECLIDIKNYRGCLPDNLTHLAAIKFGNRIINITKKDFRLFNKGIKAGPVNEDKRFINGNPVLNNPGQVLAMQVNFTGVFTTGSIIAITIAKNDCGNISVNTFTYVVLPGDTLTLIAAAFAALINAIPGIGYVALASFDFITITAINTGITFNITTYTNDLIGTLSWMIIQAHIPPKIIDTVIDVCDTVPNSGSANLASLTSANINTGDSRMTNEGFVNFLGFGGGFNTSVYHVTNGYLYVNFIENGKVGISYERLCVGEDGWPLVDETHEDAITHYCMYMNDISGFRLGKVSSSYFQWVERRWFTLCAQARGNDEMPDRAELEYLGGMFNQLLPSLNKNFF